MTTRQDYTPEEWEIISQAVANVVYVALMSDLSTLEELSAEGQVVYSGLDAKITARSDNELLMAMDTDGADVPDPSDTEESMTQLRRFTEIVDAKALPEEATSFKEFLYELADEVANAYAEQEGQPVSEKEAEMLVQVKQVLGL